MDGYVAKPINLSLLEQEIRRVAGSGNPQVPVIAAEDAAVFDLSRALAMVDDPELFVELANMFIKDVGGYLQDTGDALSAGDWERLCRGAHTLKGLFATFAAPRCEDLARQLEVAAAVQDAATCAALTPHLSLEAEALLVELRAYLAAR
jgi:HPt (histidine-containing phosphotransfer) domain-containing protein